MASKVYLKIILSKQHAVFKIILDFSVQYVCIKFVHVCFYASVNVYYMFHEALLIVFQNIFVRCEIACPLVQMSLHATVKDYLKSQ